jgi:hypothetical protein
LFASTLDGEVERVSEWMIACECGVGAWMCVCVCVCVYARLCMSVGVQMRERGVSTEHVN